MKRTFFLILLFFCALFVKADVLGPYTICLLYTSDAADE